MSTLPEFDKHLLSDVAGDVWRTDVVKCYGEYIIHITIHKSFQRGFIARAHACEQLRLIVGRHSVTVVPGPVKVKCATALTCPDTVVAPFLFLNREGLNNAGKSVTNVIAF